jgi:hypothetical protein
MNGNGEEVEEDRHDEDDRDLNLSGGDNVDDEELF